MSDSEGKNRRCSTHTLTGVQIVGTGSFVPDNVVTNEDLARLGCDADWIIKRTGIRERRHAPAEMGTSDMAVEAAKRALDAAGVSRSEIDLLVLGTFTPDYLMPQTAAAVQHKLGLNCPAVDVAAACAGFMYALVMGCQFVANGCAKNALIIGADLNSRVLDPNDIKTFPLFGDGAGAVVVTPGSAEQGMRSYTLGSDGAGADLLMRQVGGVVQPFSTEVAGAVQPDCGAPWFMSMDGRAVFKWAVRVVEDSLGQVLEAADCDRDQVRLWLLHQANVRILDAATKAMGVNPECVVKHLDRYGNTSGGSIPIAMDESFRAGRVSAGDDLALCGFGAGLSWGTALWRW